MTECSILGCGTPRRARGWCTKHYKRWQIYGDPEYLVHPRVDGPPPERFWPKVKKSEGCWIWTARINAGGYGVFGLEGRTVLAHRWSYENLVGEIPEGLHIDHICHERSCVRPEHLRPVTQKQNMENLSTPRASNASGYTGVSWVASGEHWIARFRNNYAREYLGAYPKYETHVAAYRLRNRRNEVLTHNELDRG